MTAKRNEAHVPCRAACALREIRSPQRNASLPPALPALLLSLLLLLLALPHAARGEEAAPAAPVPAAAAAAAETAAAGAAGEAGATEAAAGAGLTAREILYLQDLVTARLRKESVPEDEREIAASARARLGAQPAAGTGTRAGERAEIERRLRAILLDAVAAAPQRRSTRLDLARFYLYLDDPKTALTHLDYAGPGGEREVFWPLLSAYAHLRLGEHRAAQPSLEALDEAVAVLLPLRVRRLAFCDQIRGMGQYEPRAQRPFRPGETTWLYFEIAGGDFQKGPGGYSLDFTLGVEIRDEFQQTVWQKADYVASFRPVYQHRVEAVFGGMDFQVPEGFAAGKYTFLLRARDRSSGKEASADADFRVEGGAAPAATRGTEKETGRAGE